MLSCIALDDEPLALRVVEQFAKRHPGLLLLGTFSNPIEARLFMEKKPVDLLFLDIHMKEVDGITFARELPVVPLLVFTTAHKTYAVEGFELNSIDYLLKPFDYNRFERAVEKAFARFTSSVERPFLTVYEEYRLIKIHFDEIECIESMQDYVKIHCLNERKILTISTLKAIYERLPKNRFLRIHRSYIVAVPHIICYVNKKITLPRFTLNVGERYAKDVALFLKNSSIQ